MPGREIPQPQIEGLDKIIHVFLYLVLGLLLKIALHKQFVFSYRRYMAKYYAVTIGILYGLLMETFQHFFTASRSFELMDLFADAVGCIAGVLVFILIYRKN